MCGEGASDQDDLDGSHSTGMCIVLHSSLQHKLTILGALISLIGICLVIAESTFIALNTFNIILVHLVAWVFVVATANDVGTEHTRFFSPLALRSMATCLIITNIRTTVCETDKWKRFGTNSTSTIPDYEAVPSVAQAHVLLAGLLMVQIGTLFSLLLSYIPSDQNLCQILKCTLRAPLNLLCILCGSFMLVGSIILWCTRNICSQSMLSLSSDAGMSGIGEGIILLLSHLFNDVEGQDLSTYFAGTFLTLYSPIFDARYSPCGGNCKVSVSFLFGGGLLYVLLQGFRHYYAYYVLLGDSTGAASAATPSPKQGFSAVGVAARISTSHQQKRQAGVGGVSLGSKKGGWASDSTTAGGEEDSPPSRFAVFGLARPLTASLHQKRKAAYAMLLSVILSLAALIVAYSTDITRTTQRDRFNISCTFVMSVVQLICGIIFGDELAPIASTILSAIAFPLYPALFLRLNETNGNVRVSFLLCLVSLSLTLTAITFFKSCRYINGENKGGADQKYISNSSNLDPYAQYLFHASHANNSPTLRRGATGGLGLSPGAVINIGGNGVGSPNGAADIGGWNPLIAHEAAPSVSAIRSQFGHRRSKILLMLILTLFLVGFYYETNLTIIPEFFYEQTGNVALVVLLVVTGEAFRNWCLTKYMFYGTSVIITFLAPNVTSHFSAEFNSDATCYILALFLFAYCVNPCSSGVIVPKQNDTSPFIIVSRANFVPPPQHYSSTNNVGSSQVSQTGELNTMTTGDGVRGEMLGEWGSGGPPVVASNGSGSPYFTHYSGNQPMALQLLAQQHQLQGAPSQHGSRQSLDDDSIPTGSHGKESLLRSTPN